MLVGGDDTSLLHDLAPVVTIHFKPGQVKQQLSIPEELFLDRYCTTKTDAMRGLEQERSEASAQLERIKAREAKIRHCQQRKGTGMVNVDGVDVLEKIIAFLKERNDLILEHVLGGDEERMTQADDVLTKL